MEQLFFRTSNFDPASLPGLQLWLDATDNATITGSSPVTRWVDKSPNALAFTNTLGTCTVTAGGINGRQVIAVPGNAVLSNNSGTPIVSSGSGFYVYIVLKNTDGALQSSGLFPLNLVSSPTNASPYLQIAGGTVFGWMAFGGSVVAGWTNNAPCISGSTSNPFSIATNPYDIGIESSNGFGTLGNVSIYVNGMSQMVVNCTADLGTVSTTLTEITGGNNVAFYVGEIICGNQTLSSTSRSGLQGYLKSKWGV